MGTERIDDKDGLLKEAAAALDLADRQTNATKLAFSMVEKGKIPPFDSYTSFQEKVAEIMSKDLRVVKEALELDADPLSLGKVASETVANDATSAFFHRLAD